MIPKIIHYCWFGHNPIPENLQCYMTTWHKLMPHWEFREWNEENFDIGTAPLYARQAYAAKKFAFVSDYVRLWALEKYGGIYLDTDVEVIKAFDNLLYDTAFIGFEESLAHLPGTCVMGCEAHCDWVIQMLKTYDNVTFFDKEEQFDMTTNVQRLGAKMVENGLIANGKEQYLDKWGLHVYTYDYFSPITSTRVMRKSKNTFSIHHFASSWKDNSHKKWRDLWLVRELVNTLVQIKRQLKGIH